ncbi:MAG: hypothetical protein IH586_01080, partial [Anaerolineaceae bacterium]|nr:hypothetical protein [Anaerolineaceae bacterium]
MGIRYKFIIGCFAFLLLLGGCTNKAITPPAITTSQAPVESVQVSFAEGGSTAAQVLVHGQLPDGCTHLGDPVISNGDGLVVIILPAYRSSADQNCTGPQAYDRVIPLSSGLAPGRYTVSVNGTQAVFDLGNMPPTTLPTQAPTLPALPPTTAPTAAPLDSTPTPGVEQPT